MGRALKLREFASDTDDRLAATVRALASGRGESVGRVAMHCGMTRSALYDRLNGTSPWKASEIEAVAHHFEVTVGDLYDGLGGRFGPPRGPLAQSEELRTFNPDALTAKVLNFPTERRRRPVRISA